MHQRVPSPTEYTVISDLLDAKRVTWSTTRPASKAIIQSNCDDGCPAELFGRHS